MRKSARKKQSQVQTIQRTVTVLAETELKITVIQTTSGKVVAGFAVNAWGPFVVSYEQNQENVCLENYICVRALKHQPVPIDQVFCTHCMLCLLQFWRFQLTALPGIGVGASKFLGVWRIFAQNFPNLPKKLSCNFCRLFFWCDIQKMVSTCFSANLGRHFSKLNNVGHHFRPDFQGFCLDI